jgi:hypothetical protein
MYSRDYVCMKRQVRRDGQVTRVGLGSFALLFGWGQRGIWIRANNGAIGSLEGARLGYLLLLLGLNGGGREGGGKGCNELVEWDYMGDCGGIKKPG